ncbi:AraC family transcriptional regulator [Anaerobium acetethylicum]|uniref:AraC-type DNA-binding protein n=1 Tax=Anaerobium acetethylicum TaxID=1619234 RepID=A0A1D3TTP1_9FIRM|nr:AraC family transcriptional regulator [Anaerobium acetethylicum]SCP97358.1 AraC-type DNA-binding protein [Anaerobium acetethylicum]
MEHAIHLIDKPYFSTNRNVLTQEQLQIPGLQMFGKHTMTTAIAPLPNHYHKGCFEITYVSDGVISFSADSSDYKLSGGDVFITFPDEIHSTNLIPISVGEIFWFQINITEADTILDLNRNASADLITALQSLNSHLIKTDTKEMFQLLRKSFEACFLNQNRHLASSYLCVFLNRLIEYDNLPQSGLTQDIEGSVAYIMEHLKEELSLDTLAALCSLSTSQYKQKFKAQMGISPRSFINFQKIELSKKLLSEGMEITRTAMELGFNTSSYFSVVFKRYNTYSPSAYIKQLKR